MTDNTTELDFGTTVQKATDAEKLPVVLLALAILLGGLIVWKHRGNLKRILNGTESKFSLHHKKDEGAPKA